MDGTTATDLGEMNMHRRIDLHGMSLAFTGSAAVPVLSIAVGLAIFRPVHAEAPTVMLSQASSQTLASDVPPDSIRRSSVIDEITVSARKREESIQDVPGSITAISSDRIAQERIQGLEDIHHVAPGIAWNQEQPGRGQLVMRGLSAGGIPNDRATARQGVGLYFDDIPLGTNLRIPDLKAVDLNRVEVLRGPQGTLYGAGAMGGAIKLIGNRPNLTETAVEATAELASVDGGGTSYDVSGVLNLPVVENVFGLRLVGYHDSNAGWTDNVELGKEDINDNEVSGGRISAEWHPTDRMMVTGKIIAQKLDNSPGTARMIDSNFNDNELGFDETEARIDESHVDRLALYNLELNYDFGWAELVSSTSYQNRDADTMVDLTSLTRLATGNVLDVVSTFLELTTYEDFVQEIRLTSTGTDAFEWQVGLFYNNLEHTYDTSVPTPGFDAAYDSVHGTPNFSEQFGNKNNLFQSENLVEEEQVALFTELSYHLTDEWTIGAGLRWFDQKQDFSLAARGLLNGGETGGTAKIGEDDFNPKVVITYQPSDNVLVAAQASRGFKLGGANDIVPAGPCGPDLNTLGLTDPPAGFTSEYAWNYEVSAKTSSFNNRLVINPSVYYIEYNDIQVPVSLASCGFKLYFNGESARSIGAELEVIANLADGLDLTLAGSYNDAELTANLPMNVALDGDDLPYSPNFQGSATLRYMFPLKGSLSNFDGYTQFGIQYMDEMVQYIGWERQLPIIGRPTESWTKGDLRIGLQSERLDAALFVDNITNERWSTFNRVTTFYSVHSVNQPRVVGVSLSARF